MADTEGQLMTVAESIRKKLADFDASIKEVEVPHALAPTPPPEPEPKSD